MTQPTQAQREAAHSAYYKARHDDKPLDECWNAAITAAEQVGEPTESERWQAVANQGIHIETQLRKELLTIELATIERCAQWIVDQWGSAYQPVANAMRKSLADTPAAQVGKPTMDEKLEQWDEWYKTLPPTLKAKLSISDFRRLGDNFYRIFVLQKDA